MATQYKDNSAAVKAKLKENKSKALTAIGITAVEVVLDYMSHKYYRDIHLTGDLKRDVNFKVRENKEAVDIGNSLNYAIYVHQGTGRMIKRPYLYDAITQNVQIWKETAAKYLGDGFTLSTSFSL